ncbi:type II secretion system F family protein [Dyella sp.]|uniref:type II secretion system F family protein n=1 Tax=Dyella sp. TaxID=1869338 RepID=UPI002ED380FF
MNMSLLPVILTTFLCVTLAGYLLVRSSVAFWGRYQEAFTEQARFNLADMFMFMDVQHLFRVNAATMVLIPLLLWLVTGNPLLAVVALVLIWVLPKKIYRWMKQRRIDKIQHQLPDGLMMLAGSLRAGLGFTPALESLARDIDPPLAQEFALVLREQRMGVKSDEALEHFNDRVPVQDVALFVSAVGISREVGGNLAESMASLADTLRRRLIMEGKVKSLTAQGRLQGIVMALMPVGIIAFLSFAYPDTMHAMYHTPLGWAVMAVAAVMEYLGYRMCRKIMSIDI